MSIKGLFENSNTEGETVHNGLYGGDMLLPPSKNVIDFNKYTSMKWPNGVVPYVISAAMS